MAARTIDYTAHFKAEDALTPAAKKAADALDKLESSDDVVIKFRGDTKQVQRDIDQVLAKVDKIGGEAGNLMLTSNAAQITKEIGSLVQDIDKLDANDPTIDIKVTNIQDLEAGLARVEAKAKEINDTPIEPGRGAGGGGANVRKGFDDIITGADQANSAMANMVGNAGQDMGELIGVTGSAGVAVGQLAEYFTDSAFKAKAAGQGMGEIFKSFAAAAGPIAAISGAIFLVTAAAEAFGKPAADAAARTEALGDAMDEGGDRAVNFANVLRDNASAMQDFIAKSNDPLGGFGVAVDEIASKVPLIGGFFKEAGVDVIASMGAAGLSVYDFGTALSNTFSGMETFMSKLSAAKQSGAITGEQFNAVSEAVQGYNESARKAAATQELFNVNQEEANALMQEAVDPLVKYADQFGILEADMADGTINTEAAAQAMNELANATGMSREEIIGMAQTDIDAKMEAAAEATEQAAEAQQEYASALSSTDYRLSQIEAVAGAYTKLGEAQFGLANIASNTQAAYDDLNASIEENGFTFDNTTEKGRANADQIQNLYSSLIPQLTAAYSDAGGSIDAFGANMDQLRTGVFQQLDEQTSLSADQINAVIDQLGVFDGSTYASQFEVNGIEDANAKLALLSGVISSLPPDVQRKIALDVIAGDPYAALTEIETAVGAPGAAGTATIPIVPGEDTATPVITGIASTDWTTSINIGGDPTEGKAAVKSVDDTAAKTKPIIDVNANVEAAIVTMAIINYIARAMAPVVTVGANTFPAIGAAAAATQLIGGMHATVGVTAQLRDYPSAAEIAARIGVVRVPIDAYIRTMPRVNGAVPG